MPDAFPTQLPLDKAGGESHTIMLDEETYTISALRRCDLDALYAMLRSERLQGIIDKRSELNAFELSSAIGRCASIDPTQDDFVNLMFTDRGQRFLLWRSLAQNHKGLSKERFIEILDEHPLLGELLYQLSGLTTPPAESPEEEAEDEKKNVAAPVFSPQETG